jgi:hypothetical protein
MNSVMADRMQTIVEMRSVNQNSADLYIGINYFKNSYQPINNLLQDDNGHLLAGPQHFDEVEELPPQLLKVRMRFTLLLRN